MVSRQALLAAAPACKKPDVWLPHLAAACQRFEIATPDRIAMFLAQIAHESCDLNVLRENLNYSAERLMAVWPRRFPNLATAQRYARNPFDLANYVYGGRLGNYKPSDGWRFRGGGLIQTTGRNNYALAERGTGVPLVSQPELIEQPEHAAMAAAFYWSSHERDLNFLADDRPDDDQLADFISITQAVNGGKHGLADRRKRWEAVCKVLGLSDAS